LSAGRVTSVDVDDIGLVLRIVDVFGITAFPDIDSEGDLAKGPLGDPFS